jgi:hypothetical protein
MVWSETSRSSPVESPDSFGQSRQAFFVVGILAESPPRASPAVLQALQIFSHRLRVDINVQFSL